jgi:hypothetical protein
MMVNTSRNAEPGRSRVLDVRHAPVPTPTPPLQTITLHIPLFHNPSRFGVRLPVWPGKILNVIRELQARFSGFTLSLSVGWCTEDGVWDLHLCAVFDVVLTLEIQSYLGWWQGILQDRFKQRSIYLKSSGPVSWM